MEFGFVGLECIVKPSAEIVVSGAGIGLTEEFGDLCGDFGVTEEAGGRSFGGRK